MTAQEAIDMSVALPPLPEKWFEPVIEHIENGIRNKCKTGKRLQIVSNDIGFVNTDIFSPFTPGDYMLRKSEMDYLRDYFKRNGFTITNESYTGFFVNW
jgi:hypothetical protein